MKALFTKNKDAVNQVYNIACGERISLNELYLFLQELAHSELQPEYGPDRAGDVKHSLADISKAQKLLRYAPKVTVREGLRKIYGWYAEQFFHGGNRIENIR